MTSYPAQWECDVVLADGTPVHVRPIRAEDAPAERAFLERVSRESMYLRFHGGKKDVTDKELAYFTQVDYEDRMALIAEFGADMIAVARYDRLRKDSEAAEVAFLVDDPFQGKGVATLLLEHLAVIARQHQIAKFFAHVLPENKRMLRVFRAVGFGSETAFDGGTYRVTIPLTVTNKLSEAIEVRESLSRANSIKRLLEPTSIAVLGAGRKRGGVGHEIFRNLISGEFAGPVYPVNRTATHVASVSAFARIADIPRPVDLAVIALPAPAVLDAVQECADSGVHGLIIMSAGFAETGAQGRELEDDVVDLARRNGMRLIGPNCLGAINTDPDVRMNATFAPDVPRRGTAGFMSQSGAFGIAILDQAEIRGIGISTFVSVGNKADVSGNDMLEYWEDDPATELMLLYLESFGNPRRFARIARRISRKKPIVAVKSGRTPAGTRAAASHTAAMASTEAAVDALFRQAGVLRVDTLEELFETAQLVSDQPLPAGRRVAIVSNGGGPAILAADACESVGLRVHELPAQVQAAVRGAVPGAAAVQNPIDLSAAASPDEYEATLRTVLGCDDVDAVLVSYTPPLVTRTSDIVAAIARAAADATKPIVTNLLDIDAATEPLRAARIPAYLFPEPAARALAHAAWYSEWRAEPDGIVPAFDDIDPAAARSLVAKHTPTGDDAGWLDAAAAFDLLGLYGIPVARVRGAQTPDEAVRAARDVGFPVVLKAASPSLVHKTDVGAVALDLADADDVLGAFAEMRARLGHDMGGAIVQKQVEAGIETIVGIVHDPAFGPLVMFGMGGTAAELLGDRSFRILPLADRDASALIESIRSAPLLFGYRGSEPTDTDELAEILLRVGRLADDIPQIAELDLNPVIVTAGGARVVDAKIRLRAYQERPELSVRRLR